MTEPDDGIGARALGMMQALAGGIANEEPAPRGPARDVVSKDVALDAVMQLFAVIDEPLQAGAFDIGRGLHAMSMLMLLREYIEPLPDPPGDEALLRDDLVSLVNALAEAHRRT